jgi:hypothetical protein
VCKAIQRALGRCNNCILNSITVGKQSEPGFRAIIHPPCGVTTCGSSVPPHLQRPPCLPTLPSFTPLEPPLIPPRPHRLRIPQPLSRDLIHESPQLWRTTPPDIHCCTLPTISMDPSRNKQEVEVNKTFAAQLESDFEVVRKPSKSRVLRVEYSLDLSGDLHLATRGASLTILDFKTTKSRHQHRVGHSAAAGRPS